jgi:hypothetical protein
MVSLSDGRLLKGPDVDWVEAGNAGMNPRPSNMLLPVSCGSTCFLFSRNLRLLAAWASRRFSF